MYFTLLATNSDIINKNDLVAYCNKNQHKDIFICTNSEGFCCRAIGLYDLLDNFLFSSVTIRTANPLEKHDRYNIQLIKEWDHFFKFVDSSQYHHWNGNKVFGCFYNRPLWHRIGLASEMQTHHADRALVNWKFPWQTANSREFFELNELFYYAPESVKKFSSVVDTWPKLHVPEMQFVQGREHTESHVTSLEEIYPDFLIDIVAETWINGDCFFLTEKTVRPMLLKKPMIVMGPCNTLDYLHQMGFKTFNDFWDESYDGYSNADRYQKILELVDNLSKIDNKILLEMYDAMQPVLDHNLDLIKNRKYSKKIHYIV